MSPARKLMFRDANAVAADVRQFRSGYRQAGRWSLPQVCWHLRMVMTYTMQPPPHPTYAIDPGAKAILAQILGGGALPQIQAPERVVPPDNLGAAEIELFLETLEKFKGFRGPFAPHRLFGEIPFDDYVRFHMIHCGHHLGFLIPDAQA